MSAAQDYYERVLGLGYPPESAISYTRQYYPDFTPIVTGTSPLNTTGLVGTTPLPTSDSAFKMRTALACIVLSLILSIAGQFSNFWSEVDEGKTFGLTTVRVDCSVHEFKLLTFEEQLAYNPEEESQYDNDCREYYHGVLSDDMDAATAENRSSDELDYVFVGDMDDYCNHKWDSYTELSLISEDDADLLRGKCMEDYTNGVTGSSILWLASINAVVGIFILGASLSGRNLPSKTKRHGKWISIVAGLLMFVAVIVWWFLGSNGHPINLKSRFTRFGMGVWMTILGGVLSIVAGVLASRSQK